MSSSFVRLLHAKLLYSTIALAPLLFLLPAELQLESDSPKSILQFGMAVHEPKIFLKSHYLKEKLIC